MIPIEKVKLLLTKHQDIEKELSSGKLDAVNFKNKSKVIKRKLGDNYIYQYSMNNFYHHTIDLMKKNIFCWMGRRPKGKLIFVK